MFGKEHVNVVFEEQRIEIMDELGKSTKIDRMEGRAKTVCAFICGRNEEKN